jgi:lipopolysaccharide export system protein LptC
MTLPGFLTQREPAAPPARRPEGGRLERVITGSGEQRRHSVHYSRFVGTLKMVLPAAATALAALVLLWPQLNPADNRFRLRPVAIGVEDLENLRMVSPRFVGRDNKEQPYSVMAEQATQAAANSDVTELSKPKADILMNQGSWLAVTAEDGLYRKKAQLLDLWGKVDVFHDAGYEITTTRAHIDLDKGDAEGNEPVNGQGPDSRLEGEGFRIYDRGSVIIVTGKSRLVLSPRPAEHR